MGQLFELKDKFLRQITNLKSIGQIIFVKILKIFSKIKYDIYSDNFCLFLSFIKNKF